MAHDLEGTLKVSFSYFKPAIGQNLETCYISRLLNYFIAIRHYISPISISSSVSITFEIPQGRWRSRVLVHVSARFVSDSGFSCYDITAIIVQRLVGIVALLGKIVMKINTWLQRYKIQCLKTTTLTAWTVTVECRDRLKVNIVIACQQCVCPN